jgi:catechol 2,3-dioxygenase-like lactoylglutathione lyase family enzyme
MPSKSPQKVSLPLRSLNHISRVCADVESSSRFYRDVLGFVEIKRPDSFDFEGRWLFNYGIGIHLIGGVPPARPAMIDPKGDHLSFQSDSLTEVEERLRNLGIPCVKATVMEAGIRVSQVTYSIQGW